MSAQAKVVEIGKDSKEEAVRQVLLPDGSVVSAVARLRDCTCRAGYVELQVKVTPAPLDLAAQHDAQAQELERQLRAEPESLKNPLVKLTLHFLDGAALSQVFTTPVPQPAAMRALGRLVSYLGADLQLELPPVEWARPPWTWRKIAGRWETGYFELDAWHTEANWPTIEEAQARVAVLNRMEALK